MKYIKKLIKHFLYCYHSLQYKIHHRKFKDITILNDEQTVEYILQNKTSYARFGDGEFKWILMEQQDSFQETSETLSNRLKEVLTSNNDNILIGLPLAIKSVKNNNYQSKNYWYSIEKRIAKKIRPLLNKKQTYGNASVTRPYIDYCNLDFNQRFLNLKKLWDNRNIVIIEGEKTKLGVGNDLLKNAKSIQRILCPSQNAFSVYDKIINEAKKIDKKALILSALGPTATVLTYDLAHLGYQAIDIGHIDIEYEWYLMGAKNKSAVKGKSVNEAHDNSIENIPIEDTNYQQSIIKIIQ